MIPTTNKTAKPRMENEWEPEPRYVEVLLKAKPECHDLGETILVLEEYLKEVWNSCQNNGYHTNFSAMCGSLDSSLHLYRLHQVIELHTGECLLYLKNPAMESLACYQCDKYAWENAWHNMACHLYPLWVYGSISQESDKRFDWICLIPSSTYGIPVRSEKQQKTYNQWHDENKSFTV